MYKFQSNRVNPEALGYTNRSSPFSRTVVGGETYSDNTRQNFGFHIASYVHNFAYKICIKFCPIATLPKLIRKGSKCEEMACLVSKTCLTFGLVQIKIKFPTCRGQHYNAVPMCVIVNLHAMH